MRRSLFARLLPLALTAALSACVVVPLPQTDTGGEPAQFLEDPSGAQLNALRQRNGLAPLSHSPLLEKVAQGHANDMARMQEMTHTGSDGSTLGVRITRSGYNMRRGAENIAVTRRGLDGAMDIWTNSPPHLSHMLMPQVKEYGIARSGDYWAMVVARVK
ncbi:CAP domain-containing protein [Salipiger mangrovisoli]|uniref:CAP domain-containing protein n=1 Tax=Salipiger mangrovisoli TaxID=2865933 RepID=A0ABR9X8G8_9RHOB|nr:CAP domain-containing protein [Salipiger mangrovisoli]MBE9639737.1 CAP domain-containing protein [Salipiger mangrovisoli]